MPHARHVKPALAAAAALPLLVASPAGAGVEVITQTVGLDDPIARQIWPDVISDVAGRELDEKPSVGLLRRRDGDGHNVTVSVFRSGPTCSSGICQARIFLDGRLVGDTRACEDVAAIAFTNDGGTIESCGSRFDLPLPVQ